VSSSLFATAKHETEKMKTGKHFAVFDTEQALRQPDTHDTTK
jgi:hypothetical protein